ncbi:unnamed protein product [Nezara viridula]|uniref:Uncharacterized protein n=1 Tax=Nezara viridula TaxID=85310 RepID=A0A9P0HHJ0_NEZVI|nr:unnamed protein product [Nezara viridula]
MPDKRGLKAALGTSEVTRAGGDLGKSLLAEFIGVFFINYFGCMSCINVGSHDPKSLVLIALTFGFVVMIAVQSLGHVSGAHLNPAVTCGALVVGKVTIIRAALYIVAQCLGGIAGTGVLKAVTPTEFQQTLGSTLVSEPLTIPQAIAVEFLLGFVLIFVVFGVTDPNKPEAKIPAPLAIGLAVVIGHLSSIQYTGSSMNPARSLGSAIASNNWANHWVYWLGPCLGGIAAALLYTFVFAAPPITTQYSPVQMKRLDGKEEENA